MAEVKEHIIRTPLPWRAHEDATTECGLPANSYPSLTPEQMEAKVKREGEQRASYSSCMTCWTTRRNRGFAQRSNSLLDVLNREILRGAHSNPAAWKQLDREVRAMVLLVEAHREEFDTILRDMAEAVDLGAVRRARGKA
jgi:hypothetical protein